MAIIIIFSFGALLLSSKTFRGIISLLVVMMIFAGFYSAMKEPVLPKEPTMASLETEYVPRVFESTIEVEELPEPSFAPKISETEQTTEHDSMLDTEDSR